MFGVDLEDAYRVKSWRWFVVRIDGLLASDSRLFRYFKDDDEPAEDVPDE